MGKVKIETVKLSDIHEYDGNPRQISKQDFETLKKSLKEFPEMLAVREIVVDEDGAILGGNQRYKALLANGVDEVVVKRVIDWTEEQKREFVIKDNIANGEWDMDTLANEWDDLPLNDWGLDVDWQEEEQEVVEDEVPEVPEEPKAKLGDIYQLGEHRLMCGDSTKKEDVEALMGGVKADMVVTDPPYNVEIVGGDHSQSPNERKKNGGLTIKNDKMESDEFHNFLFCTFSNMYNVMKDGAAFYVWYASREVVNFQTAIEESGLTVKQELIWNKNSLVMGRQDYQWKHEPCLYGWKDTASHSWYGDRKQTTIIDCDRPSKSDLHPTMKPIGLFATQIQNSSEQKQIILDLFGGSGTTIMACEQTDRVCYSMEYDSKYVDVIINRWEKFTGKKAVKL